MSLLSSVFNATDRSSTVQRVTDRYRHDERRKGPLRKKSASRKGFRCVTLCAWTSLVVQYTHSSECTGSKGPISLTRLGMFPYHPYTGTGVFSFMKEFIKVVRSLVKRSFPLFWTFDDFRCKRRCVSIGWHQFLLHLLYTIFTFSLIRYS